MKNLCKFIDQNALKNNAFIIKENLNGKVCAVLKSNAYGHGLKQVASVLKNYVDFFAVLNKEEAQTILNFKKPILILEKPSQQTIDFAIKSGVHISAFCKKDVENFEKNAKKHEKTLNFHLKLNTGMNRMGVSTLAEFLDIQKFLKNCQHLNQKAVFTHFGSGNNERTKNQFKKFKMFLSVTRKNLLTHFANSEISSFVKPTKNQMARLGIAFFGYGKFFGLKPVMSVFAKVVNILKVKKGDFIGYGKKHKAKKDMTLAVIAIGYADGLMRCYHKKGFVILNNKKAKIVADICMNMTIVDISKNFETKLGDFAIILGESKNIKITANDIAKKCKTIPYEILTNFSGITVTNKNPAA